MAIDYCVGIDLGTTNTVCAIWRKGEASPDLLPIAQPYDGFDRKGFKSDHLLSSALTLRDEGIFVGFAARQLGRVGGQATFTSIKRHMGRHFAEHIGDVEWTPERVSGCILSVVRSELVAACGELPRHAVITVPASFGTEARRATLRAARWAGFDVSTLHLFDEPTAALLAELQADPKPRQERERHIIIDIGGGTLDVSLLELTATAEGTLADVVGRSRYNEIAGDDFDLALSGLLLQRFEAERQCSIDDPHFGPGRVKLCVDLLLRAAEAKEQLARALDKVNLRDYATVSLPVSITHTPDLMPWRTELSGRDLAEALRPFFTVHADEQRRRDEFTFSTPIQQCLDAAALVTGSHLGAEEIDHVWLAGGSALLPIVTQTARKIFQRIPRIVSSPMYAVALGAAWRAGMLEGYHTESFAIRERMFDGIHLGVANGSFIELVSPREVIPIKARRYPDRLSMPRFDRRFDVKLCAGLGPEDPLMTPLARRRVDFIRPVPANSPISIEVSVSENRQADFAFETLVDGRLHAGSVQVSAGTVWVEDDTSLPALGAINVPTDARGCV